MCLALPGRIEEFLDEETARVSFGGIRKDVSVVFIPKPKIGEYVTVHVGFALSRVSPEEAAKTLELMADVGKEFPLLPTSAPDTVSPHGAM